MNLLHINDLNGRSIIRWIATEMALSDGPAGEGPVLWSHLSVPYLQLTGIDIHFDDGAVCQLLSQLDDGSAGSFFGLYLLGQEAVARPSDCEAGSMFRTRELTELPLGAAAVKITQTGGLNAILRMDLFVAGRIVSFRAAEAYERSDGSFDIIGPDESILVQVDGMRPVTTINHHNAPVRATVGDDPYPATQLAPRLLDTFH